VVKEQLIATLRAVRYLERETGATTIRDVQRHCQFGSSSVARYWLAAARHKGLVTWTDGQARTIRLTPAGGKALRQWRCSICGHLLFGNEDCPVHAGQMRIAWTDEFRLAYAVQSDRIRRGKEPLKLEGLVGNRYELAARYVRLWEKAS